MSIIALRALYPRTLQNYIDYIISIINELCIRRYKKFIFLNSHGGQISHLDIAAKEIKSRYKAVDIVKAHYFLFKGFENFLSLIENFFLLSKFC